MRSTTSDTPSNRDASHNQWSKDFSENGYATTPNKGIFTVDADKFNPLPENWYSLSKSDAIKWLEANRK